MGKNNLSKKVGHYYPLPKWTIGTETLSRRKIHKFVKEQYLEMRNCWQNIRGLT